MKLLFFLSFILSISCNDLSNTEEKKATNVAVKPIVPELRETVKMSPVAEYREKTENPLNDWYFSVQLFETRKTFHYLIKLQYEEIRGTDTLKLPNFGISPQPAIEKGNEKYSCIIGFLDKDKKFREYKKVYVKENRLIITAIKHYSVSGTYRDSTVGK